MTTTQQLKAKETGFTLKNMLATTSLLLGLATASPAAAVRCGDIIDTSRSLSGTLGCDDTTNPALTIVGPAKVDLSRLTIFCSDANHDGKVPVGIRILGQEAQVNGGEVLFCENGVEVAGEGRHTVKRMKTDNIRSAGFVIESDENTLQRNQARVDDTGFWVLGHSNTLLHNSANDAFFDSHHYGFYIGGNKTRLVRNSAGHSLYSGFFLSYNGGHKLTANEATDNPGEGFRVSNAEKVTLRQNRALTNGSEGFVIFGGKQNQLSGNQARLNGLDGIRIGDSDETKLTNNVALDNNQSNSPDDFDLHDFSPNCGTHTWQNNTFGTANQLCIE